MNGRKHFLSFVGLSCIIVPLLVYYDLTQTIPLYLLSFSICDPDEDVKWKKHRHFLTHSLLWPLVISSAFFFVGNYVLTFAILCIPTVLHLSLDIPTKKRTGTYTITFYPIKKRLSGDQSFWWLLLNVIGGITWIVGIFLT